MFSIDPIMTALVVISILVMAVGLILKRLKQPYVISYIIVGLIVGPFGLKVITDQDIISRLGSIGVVLLLFFVGMEINLSQLLARWRIAIFGTLGQIGISIWLLYLINDGFKLGWDIQKVVFFGFVISLSSTAVILKILEEWKETNTRTGQNVISILITQDFAVVPMLLFLSMLSGEKVSSSNLTLQFTGAFLILALMIYVVHKKKVSIPFAKKFIDDHEIQIFAATIICFGFSVITGFFGLSTALGAFFAGIILSAVTETEWVHDSLSPFRIFFVALFFISIGMLINFTFFKENVWLIIGITILVLIINTVVNVVALMLLKISWQASFYAGALLAQVGEFSFVLAAVGLTTGIITDHTYQLTIAVIALSLLISPLWISIAKRFACTDKVCYN